MQREEEDIGTSRVKKNMEDVQRNLEKRVKVMRERGGKTLGTCR
jgi:translation elongation factor EF-Ts